MKKRERILRIRPFNMANFSGGAGYMPMMVVFGTVASIPVLFFFWTGIALPVKTESGRLDYYVLIRRLKRIVLPICLALFVLQTWLGVNLIYGGVLAYLPAGLWGAAFHTLGIYVSMRLSASLLVNRERLTKGKWLLLSMAFMIPVLIIGWLFFMFGWAFTDLIVQ